MSKVMSKDEVLVSRLIETLEQFRSLDPEMPVQTMLTLLQVARKEGQSMTELSKVMEMPISSMSRNLTTLSKINRQKQPGLDLVAYESDPMVDSRAKSAPHAKGAAVPEADPGPTPAIRFP
jgi:DNA-binding MarR family transcriptional regulator